MTDKNKKADKEEGRLTEDQRFKYVGFDVYPGKIKDLFKSDAEKDMYVRAVSEKRSSGELLRDHCTLTEERVSLGERVVLTVVSLIIIGALFLPWYSAYTEVTETSPAEEIVSEGPVMDSTGAMVQEETLPDSLAAVGSDMSGATEGEEIGAVEGTAESQDSVTAEGEVAAQSSGESEMEVITGVQARIKTHRDYVRLSGIGGLISLGSVGSYVFSSGFILILTGVIFILYTLAAVGLPLFALYTTWGVKASGDEHALRLKKVLRHFWWPVLALVVAIVLSFVGANYGFDSNNIFTSIGTSYGIGVLIDSLSWGVFVTMAGFVLMAAKGMEI